MIQSYGFKQAAVLNHIIGKSKIVTATTIFVVIMTQDYQS